MDLKYDHSSSFLSCELRIIRARNIDDDAKSRGEIFIRCYLSSGNNTRVKLDTKQISANSNFITWNQTFSLDCLGSENSIKCLKQETLVFDLRSINTASFLGKFNGSKLIGRAEIPWKLVFESETMEIEKWVFMVPQNGRVHDDHIDVKPIGVQIGVKIKESINRKKMNERKYWDEECCNNCMDCGCNSCHVDYYEYLAIGAALEDL